MADAVDPFGGLSGDQRDAYAAMLNVLQEYGLESLAPTVMGFIKNGYSSDTISVLLQDTEAYKQRFAANESRRQRGLPVLSPAEYLATERAYRQVMSAAGLPPGYYDQPSDFQNLLSNDVSPTEVQQRVFTASKLLNQIDPNVLDYWKQFYTTGDIVAYALDPTVAAPVLDRQYQAAEAAGFAKTQGLSIGQGLAEQIASTGISDNSIQQGMGTAAQLAGVTGKLSAIYGGDYTDETAAQEVFLNDSSAAKKRQGLASQERAQFGGSSGLNRTSLVTKKPGQL